MLLSDVPTLCKAFQYILDDNHGELTGKIDPTTKVSPEWENRFRWAETYLSQVVGKDVRTVLPQSIQNQDPILYTEGPGDNPDWMTTLWCIANPVNDQNTLIMDELGWSPDTQVVVNDVLGEFFDGELASQFTIWS